MKQIKTTEYLYNIQPQTFSSLPYPDAIKLKIKSAKQLVKVLLEEHYSVRDVYRLNHVLSAIKFNQRLIDELTAKHQLES